jgi:hypothetical protein
MSEAVPAVRNVTAHGLVVPISRPVSNSLRTAPIFPLKDRSKNYSLWN